VATSVRAREAGQQRLAELASALTAAHDRLGPQLGDDSRARLEQAHDALVGMLDALAAGLEVPPAEEALEALGDLAGEAVPEAPVRESIADLDLDPEMVEIFFEEADELFETIDAALDSWPAGDDSGAEELMRALHTLKGGARMAGLGGLGSEAHELESWIGARRETPDAAFFTELRRRSDTMAERIAALRRGEAITMHGTLDAASTADAGAASGSPPAVETPSEPAPEPEPETPAPAAEQTATPAAAPVAARAADAEDLEDADPEILELFREEAGELLEMLDASVLGWRGEPANEIHLEGLLRVLHTLKGSARMAGLADLGEAAHELESRLVDRRGQPEPRDDAFFSALQADTDALSERIAALAGVPASAEPPPADGSEPGAAAPAPTPEPAPEREPEAAAKPADSPPPERTPDLPGVGDEDRARRDGPVRESREEMIRVSSDLLDDLVSLAGETSITRGRIQQEISDFSAALEEMDATIERIRDQVRRLDSTAQEQIHFGREAAERADEDFDPLEMDRYTQLQELTRTLFESASDVGDLRETLVDRLRNADTLLLQQARINTELQEGLMRTRMVPFARLLPRLKRIVRQVGRELGKPVELEVENAEGELDRNVLERMIAPLEHMLRNAVDHGLEKPEARAERGKPHQGTITLRLSQPGGEILIEVADDGGGINVEGVRAKAIERGLLSVESDPDESEILSFIMSPGFSTAKSVTQLSGRGVGMDVVNSEVKQLGGSITVASTLGEGTVFSVRLPYTVSVSRALMVSVGDDSYAVPLSGIEGIVRVPPAQLQRRYDSGGTSFDYAGRSYELSGLAEWLGLPRSIPDDVPSVPVLMVRAGDTARAVHVDAVSGSREIVVKNLGPQFAGVAGVSGATILGDGSVVVILDLPAMLRSGASLRLAEGAVQSAPEPAAPSKHHVLVVDDSVTVRKVTSRLLERQGFRVSLAKDGVEAVGLLAEMRPDLMLLDIEMPRMDGFEVATHVRNEERLEDLPIIMITSRTGEKHRERAEGIGVDRFLGKPFQEPDLLAAIEELTGS
jgi:chemosensory pili system protein ChpA (sensor histidine kinase/response regulator)